MFSNREYVSESEFVLLSKSGQIHKLRICNTNLLFCKFKHENLCVVGHMWCRSIDVDMCISVWG